MRKIGGIGGGGVLVEPGSFPGKVRFGSRPNTREHHHHDREPFGFPISQNEFRILQRIPTKQFPLSVREKIERLAALIDEIPSVFTDANRPGSALNGGQASAQVDKARGED